jgi:hypothetical protein
MLCYSHECKKSLALLQSPQNQGPNKSGTERYFQKSWFLRQSRKMGNGFIEACNIFLEKKCHRVTSPSIFHRGLDRTIELH